MNNNSKPHAGKTDNLTQEEQKEQNQEQEQSAEDTNATGPAADVAELEQQLTQSKEEIEKLKEDISELKNKNLRLLAEFDNARRRSAKEAEEMRKVAGKDVVQALLTAVDDMNRASKQLETSTDLAVIKEGITLVFGKIRTTLQQKGLKEMDALNKDFDPDLHEAITEIPTPDEDMKGKVLDVVEAGYYLNDKLIRHAKVVVGK